jgi:hypothetical protein
VAGGNTRPVRFPFLIASYGLRSRSCAARAGPGGRDTGLRGHEQRPGFPPFVDLDASCLHRQLPPGDTENGRERGISKSSANRQFIDQGAQELEVELLTFTRRA